jgi:hypothetical protein
MPEGGVEGTIGGKPISDETKKKVGDALKKTLEEELEKVSGGGNASPMIHGSVHGTFSPQ